MTAWNEGLVPLQWQNELADPRSFVTSMQRLRLAGIQVPDMWLEDDPTLATLSAGDIALAEKYVAIPCSVDGPTSMDVSAYRSMLDRCSETGVDMIVLAVDGSNDRDRFGGRPHEAPALTPAGMRALGQLVAELTTEIEARSMRSSFHPHGATYIESPDETHALFDACDNASLGLCLDTGHWIVGGGDPVAAIIEYGARVTHVHLKDVDGVVLKRLRGKQMAGMEEAVVREYLFTTVGAGLMDVEGVISALRQQGFAGWIMLEQDSTPLDAFDSTLLSRAVLSFVESAD